MPELSQWVFFDGTGGARTWLVPRGAKALFAEAAGEALRGGPLFESPELPFPLVLAWPNSVSDEARRAAVPAGSLEVTLQLGPDAPTEASGGLLLGPDEVGAMSALSEYLRVVAELGGPLRLPPKWLRAGPDGSVELGLDGGAVAELPLVDRLLLLRAAADGAARARGFRVAAAQVAVGGSRRPLDGRLVPRACDPAAG